MLATKITPLTKGAKGNTFAPLTALECINVELCKRAGGLYEFVQIFWTECENGGGRGLATTPYEDSAHIKYLCDILEETFASKLPLGHWFLRGGEPPKLGERHLMINICPSTSKSTIVSRAFPIWAWVIEPTIKFITVSSTAAKAKEYSNDSLTIMRTERFIRYFGGAFNISDTSYSKAQYENDKGGARLSLGREGAITGSHAHFVIADDLITAIDAKSPAVREQVVEWIKAASSRGVVIDFTIILLAQRLSISDPCAIFETSFAGHLRRVVLPAEITEKSQPYPIDLTSLYIKDKIDDGRLILTGRVPSYELDIKRLQLGDADYNAQYLQYPTSSDDALIKSEYLRRYSIDQYQKLVNSLSIAATTHFYVDTAETDKQKGDPTAIIAYQIIGGALYVIKVLTIKKQYLDMVDAICEFIANNNTSAQSAVYIEPKTLGRALLGELGKRGYNAIEGIMPKGSKEERCKAILPIFRAGRVYVPELTPENSSWLKPYLSELTTFPNSLHDDQLDVTVGAIQQGIINDEIGILLYDTSKLSSIIADVNYDGYKLHIVCKDYSNGYANALLIGSKTIGSSINMCVIENRYTQNEPIYELAGGIIEDYAPKKIDKVFLYRSDETGKDRALLGVSVAEFGKKIKEVYNLRVDGVTVPTQRERQFGYVLQGLLSQSNKNGHTLKIDTHCLALINDLQTIRKSKAGGQLRPNGKDATNTCNPNDCLITALICLNVY